MKILALLYVILFVSSCSSCKKPVNSIGIVGVKEKVSFPMDSISNVNVRIDTGADMSAMHATNISEDNGFVVFDFNTPSSGRHVLRKKILNRVFVRNTSGKVSKRYVVKVDYQLGEHRASGYFNLVDRSRMNEPVLLGVNELKGYLVDPSTQYVLKK